MQRLQINQPINQMLQPIKHKQFVRPVRRRNPGNPFNLSEPAMVHATLVEKARNLRKDRQEVPKDLERAISHASQYFNPRSTES